MNLHYFETMNEMSFKKRLFFTACPLFLLLFTLLIFGPIDLFFSNMSILDFSISDVAGRFIPLTLGLFLTFDLLISLSKGLLYQLLISLLLGGSIAVFIQGNFLNLDLGLLDGTTIDWSFYTTSMIMNALVWILILAIPIFVSIFYKRIITRIVIPISVILISTQAIVLTGNLITHSTPKNEFYFLSSKDQFTLSSTKNIVVLSLDRVPNSLMDSVLEENPEIESQFSDFTRYINNTN